MKNGSMVFYFSITDPIYPKERKGIGREIEGSQGKRERSGGLKWIKFP